VECQVLAHGRDRRRWVIDYLVFPGHISDPKCQTALDGLMTQTWVNAYGRRLPLDMLAIDGNAWTEDVWSWVRKWPAARAMMVRGANGDHAPLLERVKRERGAQGQLLKYSRRFYNFGTSVLKLALYRNLQKSDPLEPGYVGFPTGLDDEYFRQLTAETPQAGQAAGRLHRLSLDQGFSAGERRAGHAPASRSRRHPAGGSVAAGCGVGPVRARAEYAARFGAAGP